MGASRTSRLTPEFPLRCDLLVLHDAEVRDLRPGYEHDFPVTGANWPSVERRHAVVVGGAPDAIGYGKLNANPR